MIALIEPPMIAIMEPLKSAQKAISDGFLNYGFSPPFGVVFPIVFFHFFTGGFWSFWSRIG